MSEMMRMSEAEANEIVTVRRVLEYHGTRKQVLIWLERSYIQPNCPFPHQHITLEPRPAGHEPYIKEIGRYMNDMNGSEEYVDPTLVVNREEKV